MKYNTGQAYAMKSLFPQVPLASTMTFSATPVALRGPNETNSGEREDARTAADKKKKSGRPGIKTKLATGKPNAASRAYASNFLEAIRG